MGVMLAAFLPEGQVWRVTVEYLSFFGSSCSHQLVLTMQRNLHLLSCKVRRIGRRHSIFGNISYRLITLETMLNPTTTLFYTQCPVPDLDKVYGCAQHYIDPKHGERLAFYQCYGIYQYVKNANLVILKATSLRVQHKPSILPSFHNIGVFEQLAFKWLPTNNKDNIIKSKYRKFVCLMNKFVCLLLNGTSALFRPLVPRIV